MDTMPLQKKKLCLLTPALVLGGVERVLMDTVPLLAPYYDVSILALQGEPDPFVAKSLQSAGATLLAPNLPAKPALMLVPYLSKFHYEKILKTIEYDVLICVNAAALNAGFNKKAKKTVFWNHVDNVEKYVFPSSLSQKIKRSLFKILYKKYDAVWTVCDKIKQDFQSAFRLKNVFTLSNPIDCAGIVEKSNRPCDVQFDKNYVNAVTIGRFSEEKGFDRVVKIWEKHVLSKFPNARLYLIGDSDKATQETIKSNPQLSNQVFLLGKQENPFPYLKQADLFICPSRKESFGLVILEAMLLGIPVITTATAGGITTTQNGKYAVCVDNNDDALKDAILSFLENKEAYPYSVSVAQELAKNYDLDSYQKSILSLLSQLT